MIPRFGMRATLRRSALLTTCRHCSTKEGTPAAADSVSGEDRLGAPEKELKEKEKLLEQLRTENLYNAAACENLRKDFANQKKQAETQAVQVFAKDMLEVCDALQVVARKIDEYQTQNPSIPQSQASVLAGVKVTEDVALKTLRRYGVCKTPVVVGSTFDENTEVRLYTVPSTNQLKDGAVAEVVKDAYSMNGSILRKAEVAVGEDP